MPATCALTGKTYMTVKKRSHSNRGTNTKVHANLQKIRVGNKTIKVSARALRTLKKKFNK